MSNTILISGASETLNVTVNPTLINVSVAIEEAAVTNTLEVNQFAGAYVSTIEAGDGIVVSSSSGDITISSSNLLSNNRFGVYESSNTRLVDAPAQIYIGSKSYIDFSDQDNNGSVQVYFNSKEEETVLLVPTSVNYTTASGIPNNVRSFTVYDSFRDLYYVGQNDGTNDFVTVINPDGTLNRTHTFEGISIFAQAQYSVSNDVVFAVSTRDDIVYAFDPSDFSIIDSISTGVVDGGYISYWSENSGRLFLSYIQAGSLDGIVSFDFANNSFSANGESSMEQPLYFLQSFIETSDGSLYAIDGFARFSSYSSVDNSFSYVTSLDGFAPTMVYAPDTDKIWMTFAENASSTNSRVYEYDYNSDVLSLIAEFVDSGQAQVRYDEDLVWVIKPQATYSSDIGLTTVFDPVSKSLVSSFTEGNYTDGSRSPIINGGVLFDATGLYSFTFTEAQLHSRNYPSALKLTYGFYTQPEGDAPVDPKTDIELTVSGTNYVSHSGDTLSHHFFTNDTSGNDKKVLSIGNETLYVFNANGASSTVTKAKIDNWDLAGPGLQSVSFNTADGVLTITDTEDTDFTANLDGRYLQTETVTTISFANNVVSYVDEDGVTTDIDLSAYLDNTNDFVSSGTFTDGELTLSIPNQGDVIINLDGRYLRSIGSLTDNFFGVYDSSTGQLVDAPAKFIDGDNPSVEFFDNTVVDKGSVSVEFNSLDGDALPEPDATVNSVSTIENVSVSLNTTTVTVYDSSRDLFYAFYKQSADSTLRYDVFNLSGEKTVSYQVLLTGIDFGTRSIGPSLYSADLDVLFIPLGNSEGSNEVYVIDPSDFSVVDSANFGVVTPSDPFGNLYYITRGSHYSHSLGSVFLSQSGGTVSVLDFNGSTLSNHRSIDAVDNEAFRTTIYGVFEDTDNSNVYCVDEYRYVYIYSNANDTFTYIGSRLPENSSLTNIVFVPGSGSVWIRYSDNELTTDTLAKYNLSNFSLTTIETYTIENNSDVTDRLYIQYNEYDQSVYATSFGTIDVYDTSTDTSIFTSTVLDIKGLLGETVMFSTVEDKMFVFTYTVIQESIRDYSSAVKLKYGSYTQLEGDAPVDPKLDIELTADGANYVGHSGDTISHHFFTNDSAGNDVKVLSIGDQTLYVFNTAGESSTVTKAKIDAWDGYGSGIESVSFNTTTGLLTITDTASVDYSVSLEGRYLTEETVTSLSFASNSLTYTDEDSTETVIDLSAYLDNTDTTYDLSSKDNATEGVDIDLIAGGDGSGTDTITLVGTNDVSVSVLNNVITVDAPQETITSILFVDDQIEYTNESGATSILDLSKYNETITNISFNSTTDVITYVNENGTELTLNLSKYNETLTSISFLNNVISYVDEDNVTTNIDLSAYLDNENDFVTTASFAEGTLTLGVSNQNNVTVDLDGRYLQSETLTVLSFTGDNLTYTDEAGSNTIIDLSGYNETLTSISILNDSISYVDENGVTTNLDLSAYLDDTNDFVTEASFIGGTLTLNVGSQDDVAVSLDGRYLQSETLTSLSFAADNLTYTDEAGTDTVIDLSGFNDTLTSISFVGDSLTYTDEAGNDTIIDLSGYNETLTSLAYASGTLTYTDENGGSTQLDISGLSGDTSYDLTSAANATSGADLKLTGSDSTTDTVNIIGTNAVTVTGAAGTITIDAPDETLTSLSYANDTLTYTDENGSNTAIDLSGFTETVTSISLAANNLTYTNEAGNDTVIDLSLYLDDTNLARLVSGTLDANTGVATFTRDDATTFDLDLSSLLDTDTDTTYDLSTKDNATEGIDLDLTAGGDGSGTDTVTFKGTNAVTITQASNVITIDAPEPNEDNYVDTLSFNEGTRILTIGRTGSLIDLTTQIPDMYVDGATWASGSGNLTISRNSSLPDITVNLDGRYLTSYTETDTLDSVASRGNTTNQSIKIGEDGGDPLSELHVVGTLTIEGTDQNATSGSTAMQVQINDNKTALTTAQKAFITAKTAQTFEDKQVSLVSSSDINGGIASVFTADTSGYAYYANHLRMGGGTQGFIRYDVGKWSGTGTAYEDISAAGLEAFVIGRWESTGARTDIFRISSSGMVTVDGTVNADAFQDSSSIRYKENVIDLEDFTEAVMAMRPVRYDIKKNGKNDIGFIAEEVNELIPEVVGKNHDGEVESVNYARLSVVLLQQVQKQQSLIEKLEERISKLESK